MTLRCPRCESWRVAERRLARRIVGALGTLAGAVGSVLSSLGGAEAGMAVGALAGPGGAVVGMACGAVLAALTGGATGCILGTRLGQAIDEHLLDAHACLSCGHHFGQSEPPVRAQHGVSPDGYYGSDDGADDD
jgi:hypothetical protein